MTKERKIEILYDHYKDTFENQKVYLQRRNNYTIICLVLIAAFAFQILNPSQTVNLSNELIKKNIGSIKIDFSYINNVLSFALLWISIMYYQINFLIEKHYTYIQEIEVKLTKELETVEISREGKSYLDHYPWLSEVVHRIYTILFPSILIFVAIAKWIKEKEIIANCWCNGSFWIETIFLFTIILISLLYLINRHFNDFRRKK